MAFGYVGETIIKFRFNADFENFQTLIGKKEPKERQNKAKYREKKHQNRIFPSDSGNSL